MANKYPYVNAPGGLIKTFEHLRRSFPKEVSADTLRKLGLAPKNESYIINVLRYLGVIDDEGMKVVAKTRAFVQHKDELFHKELEKVIRDAYADLFELHADATWALDKSGLAQFFRTSDHSSEIVGKRQANTFQCLAGMAGHGDLPSTRAATKTSATKERKKKGTKSTGTPQNSVSEAPPARDPAQPTKTDVPGGPNFGLTVRVEVNLPADGSQETYDRIFKSIRKNLIDGK